MTRKIYPAELLWVETIWHPPFSKTDTFRILAVQNLRYYQGLLVLKCNGNLNFTLHTTCEKGKKLGFFVAKNKLLITDWKLVLYLAWKYGKEWLSTFNILNSCNTAPRIISNILYTQILFLQGKVSEERHLLTVKNQLCCQYKLLSFHHSILFFRFITEKKGFELCPTPKCSIYSIYRILSSIPYCSTGECKY